MDLAQAIDWIAREFDGSHAEARVLLNIVSRADKHGICNPSYRRIAGDCRMGRRTAMRTVAALAERGLVNIERCRTTDAKRHRTNRFHVAIPPPGGVPRDTTPSVPRDTTLVSPVTPRRNPVKEPSWKGEVLDHGRMPARYVHRRSP